MNDCVSHIHDTFPRLGFRVALVPVEGYDMKPLRGVVISNALFGAQ